MSNKTNKLKYNSIISQMTLKEKASLMSGANFWNTQEIKRLGIPSIMLTDGPHGLRKQGGKADHLGLNKSLPATCFPTAATLANSWDVSLIREIGNCLGREAAKENVSVLLGPGLNIKRNPLCGRNFEYFSEDPYLTGKLAASMIQGIQETGVSACPKHFAVNSQETYRMIVDEIVDERALHEIYLEGFRYVVKEGNPKTIMTSYNKVNGTYANENEYLLKEVLQNDWGYDGLIVTDWGGSNDRVSGLIAGNALEMPSTNGMTNVEIEEAVNSGKVSEHLLNERVDNLLSLVYSTLPNEKIDNEFSYESHHQKAIDAACRSIVLLKNESDILPITDNSKKIAIVGDFAKNPRYQGAGSSLIHPTEIDNFLKGVTQTSLNVIGYEKGFNRFGSKNNSLQKKACKLAASADIVLLFLGLDEGSEAEGVDRKHMCLSNNQIELANKISEYNQNVILVLAGGSPIEMPFINKVKGILHGYLTGQGGGSALAKVITGEYNPSGKLSESYPISYQDVASSKYYPGKQLTSEHRESIFIGYRHYDTANKEVLFPFGFGLSYTEFHYSDLEYEDNKVTLTISNVGKFDGEEIVQVYVKPLARKLFHAEKELKGFSKVKLAVGESKTITIDFEEHSFAYYHIEEKKWVSDSGDYEIMVGASSRDIRLTKKISIIDETFSYPYSNVELEPYEKCKLENITSADFEKLLGKKLPQSKWDENKQLDINDIIEQSKYKGFFGRSLYKIIIFTHKLLKKIGKPIAANNVMFILELPFRSVARMSGGKVNYEKLDGILLMVNGQFFKGLTHYIKYNNKNKKGENHEKKGN